MDKKRNVYNGYEEKIWTGLEIKKYLANAYLCYGRHHKKVSSYKLNFEKYYPRLKNEVVYRVFINALFCKIMDEETDENIYFLGYTFNKPAWAKD